MGGQGPSVSPEIETEIVEEQEEQEWEALNAQPEIQCGLSRLAKKIRADIATQRHQSRQDSHSGATHLQVVLVPALAAPAT